MIDPAVRRRLVIDRVSRRIIPFVFICYVVAYIDRVNIGFAAECAAARPRPQPHAVRHRRRPVLSRLLPVRDSEQPDPRTRRRAALDRADHDRLGHRVDGDDVRHATSASFYVARVVLGHRRGGLLPRRGALPDLLDPGGRARAHRRAVHDGGAGGDHRRRAGVGSDAAARRRGSGCTGGSGCSCSKGCRRWCSASLALRVLTDRPGAGDVAAATTIASGWPRTMSAERAQRGADRPRVDVRAACASGRVWLLCAVYFLNTTVTYGIFLWLPKILRGRVGLERLRAERADRRFRSSRRSSRMVLVGRHSDRTGERKLHVAGVRDDRGDRACSWRWRSATTLWLLVLSFTLSQMGQRSVMSVFWAIPPMLLGGTAAAAGIGLINAVGNLGGFFGPSIMGMLRDATGGYSGGLLVLAGALVLEAILVLSLRLPTERAPQPLIGARAGTGAARYAAAIIENSLSPNRERRTSLKPSWKLRAARRDRDRHHDHPRRSRRRLRGAAAAAQARRAAQPRSRRRRARRARTSRPAASRGILYGGNAFLYHITLDEFEALLGWLAGVPGDALGRFPSLGPSFGRAMDQARLLRRHAFRCAMMLPCGDPRDARGMEAGLREIADAAGMPLILYLKSEDGFGADLERGPRRGRPADRRRRRGRDQVRRRARRSAATIRISTACCAASIARASSAAWASGRRSCTCATSSSAASRPARAASRPRSCSALFDACAAQRLGRAPRRCAPRFMPLEDLRDAWGPARVLHHATELAGIAPTGPDPAVRLARSTAPSSTQLAPVARALAGSARMSRPRQQPGGSAQPSLVRQGRSALVRPSLARQAGGLQPRRHRRQAGHRHPQHLERRQSRATRTSGCAPRRSSAASGRPAGSRWRSRC